MRMWKIERLKDDIKSGSFSEKERFLYGLIYFTLIALFIEASYMFPAEPYHDWDYVLSFMNILVMFFGCMFAYRSNGGHKGTDFLGRFLSISIVVTIRFLLLLIPIIVILAVYYAFTFGAHGEIVTTPFEVVLFQGWSIAILWRVCVHIKAVSTPGAYEGITTNDE